MTQEAHTDLVRAQLKMIACMREAFGMRTKNVGFIMRPFMKQIESVLWSVECTLRDLINLIEESE